jgi:hypothetical protein
MEPDCGGHIDDSRSEILITKYNAESSQRSYAMGSMTSEERKYL